MTLKIEKDIEVSEINRSGRPVGSGKSEEYEIGTRLYDEMKVGDSIFFSTSVDLHGNSNGDLCGNSGENSSVGDLDRDSSGKENLVIVDRAALLIRLGRLNEQNSEDKEFTSRIYNLKDLKGFRIYRIK